MTKKSEKVPNESSQKQVHNDKIEKNNNSNENEITSETDLDLSNDKDLKQLFENKKGKLYFKCSRDTLLKVLDDDWGKKEFIGLFPPLVLNPLKVSHSF